MPQYGKSANWVVTGISENDAIDPIIGFPEFDAVLWKNSGITNLGTFGGTSAMRRY
jgi:hypothetical protein